MENKNLELMNIKDITDYIIETFHVPLRKDLLDVTFLLNKLEIKYDDEDQSILFLIEFFSKFKLELPGSLFCLEYSLDKILFFVNINLLT